MLVLDELPQPPYDLVAVHRLRHLLAELLPDTAERVTTNGTEQVSLSALAVDDIVLVRPGARVPADGEIIEGTADVDESMITGESRPVRRGEGDRVVAGTVSADSAVRALRTASTCNKKTARSATPRSRADSATRARAWGSRSAMSTNT